VPSTDLYLSDHARAILEERNQAALLPLAEVDGVDPDAPQSGYVGDHDRASGENAVRTTQQGMNVHDKGPPGHLSFLCMLRTWAAMFRVTSTAFTVLLAVLAAFGSVGVMATTTKAANGLLKLPTTVAREDFDRMVVCPGCQTVYALTDCWTTSVDRTNKNKRTHAVKKCQTMIWKNNVGTKCKTPLAYAVRGRMRPNSKALVYPYLSVTKQLELIMGRDGMEEKVVQWRDRTAGCDTGDYMSDVQDGAVFREFQTLPDGEPFLADRGLALMLNTDGFQPAASRNYSVDAIYLAIMNLPRAIRYCRENMILVALVPGKQKKVTLQTFVKPLVDEMLTLWKVDNVLKRRVAILCVACDTPACTTLGGFCGHAGRRFGFRSHSKYPSVKPGSQKTYFGGPREGEAEYNNYAVAKKLRSIAK
jgi:hypothetical protein